MSKAFPLAKNVFLKVDDENGAEFAIRLKPRPASNFAKAKTVAVELDGVAVAFPTTNSKGWTPDESILYYLWVVLPDGTTGWITSDYGVPFVVGTKFVTVEGETKRADPVRVLLSGESAPETRRLAGFKAAWAAKKSAPSTPAAEGEAPAVEEAPEVEAPAVEAPKEKKKGKK